MQLHSGAHSHVTKFKKISRSSSCVIGRGTPSGEERTREDRRSATRESMCYPRENKTRCSFVVLFPAGWRVARRAARASGRHRWCLSPTEVCLDSNVPRLGKAWSLSCRPTTTATMASLLLVGSLIEPDVGPGVWLGLGLGAGWHDRPGPNDRWAGDAPLRHDGPRFFAPFSPSANRARKRSKRRLVLRAPPNSSSRA